MSDTIRAGSTETPLRYDINNHTIFFGDMMATVPRLSERNSVDLLFLDTPGVDPDCSVSEYRQWFSTRLGYLTQDWLRHDCGMILVPRDRKGHPWQKSVISAYVANMMGWETFRQFIVMGTEGDFHRARYCYQPVWAMRRGNMPVASAETSPARFKDVLRIKDTAPDSMVWGFPDRLVDVMLQLFKGVKTVMDPFAGTGAVLKGAQRIGMRSISCEIDTQRAAEIVSIAERSRWG